MRVLWFSNCILTLGKTTSSGTWLYTMAESLVANGVELINITQSSVKDILKKENNGLIDYLLPRFPLKNGLPNQNNIRRIVEIVKNEAPDIIHIWGMESYFGLLASRLYIKGNVILEIQGIKSLCVPVFYGCLSQQEVWKCIGIRELLKPSLGLYRKRHDFKNWSKYEKEMVGGIANISTQSDWVRSWVRNNCSPNAHIYNTSIIVRKPFLLSEKWSVSNSEERRIFALSAGSEAYKGIHIALYAVKILKQQYPNVELRIAGAFGQKNEFYRKPGYTIFLQRLINKLGIKNNVIFVGPLSASQIVEELHKARCFLQTSFVESYSLALAEAMAVGMPCVVSYAGAMIELAKDNFSALFYPPMEYYTCAEKICRLFESPNLCATLSQNAREMAIERNDERKAVLTQLSIYNDILKKSNIL